MPRVWVKVPKTTRLCVCGCGVSITGTARKMYAKPYCKLKMHLRRTKGMKLIPKKVINPMDNMIPFTLKGDPNEDMSSPIEAG